MKKATILKLLKDLKEAGVVEATINSDDINLSVKFRADEPFYTEEMPSFNKEEALKQYENILLGND